MSDTRTRLLQLLRAHGSPMYCPGCQIDVLTNPRATLSVQDMDAADAPTRVSFAASCDCGVYTVLTGRLDEALP